MFESGIKHHNPNQNSILSGVLAHIETTALVNILVMLTTETLVIGLLYFLTISGSD
jgi:hypothetical protein